MASRSGLSGLFAPWGWKVFNYQPHTHNNNTKTTPPLHCIKFLTTPANKPMKYIYIMAAWENDATTHPAIQTFTSKSMAIAVAKDYRDYMHFKEVIIRRDLINSSVGWNSVGTFVEF